MSEGGGGEGGREAREEGRRGGRKGEERRVYMVSRRRIQ
jgi:hypothetical protein